MNAPQLPPLSPGDIALRFRVAWPFAYAPAMAVLGVKIVPKIVGIEAVEVLAVDGERVTWTNHKPSEWQAGRFEHTSNRRELMSLAAFDFTPAAGEGSPADTHTLAKRAAG